MIKGSLYEKSFLFFLFFLTVFVFFKNIGVNDIWIPNESFYAESAMEMVKSGNYLDVYYNYTPRFNKPPMTYWLVAASYKIFGISEFSARLPVVVLSFFSVVLTYLIARKIFCKRTSVFSAMVMVLSLQFIVNSRYASPENVLTFFFTFTLYFFIKGYKERRFLFIFLSYFALGLTVLTKGYPYILIIGGIVFLYICLENSFNLRKVLTDLRFLRLHIGIPLVLAVGFWWYLYMYFKFGRQFLDVLMTETLKRAVSKKGGGLAPLFYFNVILWGFLPYSLVAYFGLFNIKNHFKKLIFPFSWIVIMLGIFTLAKGKIPTYIIQMHPALSILTGYFLANYEPESGAWKRVYSLIFQIPALVFLLASCGVICFFKLPYYFYLLLGLVVPFCLLLKEIKLYPFISALIFFFIFTVGLLPAVERFRPYDGIGRAVKRANIEKSVPLIVENYFWHNLPFYAERKVIRDVPFVEIINQLNKGRILALVKSNDVKKLGNVKILWKGKLYRRGSESRFAIFLKYVAKAIHGDFKGFEDRVLIYKE